MDRRLATTAALVAGLAVLAGCGAAGLLADGTATPTPAARFVAAPGLDAAGVADVGRLAAAHRASLRGTSYTLRTELVVRRPDGTERARRTTVLRVAADGRRFSMDRRASGAFPEAIRPEGDRSAWSPGDHTYVRFEERGRWAYARYPHGLERAVVVLDGHEAAGIYLGGLRNATVEEVTADGWLAYRLSATEPSGTETVAVVDSFGLLRSMEVVLPAGEVFWLHGEGTAVRRLAYERVGNTTVARPPWVDEAVVAAGRPDESD